jgi:hypothetical protein
MVPVHCFAVPPPGPTYQVVAGSGRTTVKARIAISKALIELPSTKGVASAVRRGLSMESADLGRFRALPPFLQKETERMGHGVVVAVQESREQHHNLPWRQPARSICARTSLAVFLCMNTTPCSCANSVIMDRWAPATLAGRRTRRSRQDPESRSRADRRV